MNNENWGPLKLIHAGFWIGIGFIIPTLIVDFGTMAAMWSVGSEYMESEFEEILEDEDGNSIYSLGEIDVSKLLIQGQRVTMRGNQLLISGKLVNEGDESPTSVELEAELFDAEGVFVYECTEHLSQEIAPGGSENYQIKCGCGENGVPEYVDLKVKVVSATNY